jgi:RNA-directed DNA polymerase
MARRMHAKLKELKESLRRRMHDPIAETGRWLRAVVSGHIRYFGVPRNSRLLGRFRDRVRRLWHRALNRRSQMGYITEARMTRIASCWLPPPRICQPYPAARLAVIIQGKSPVR